VGQLAPAPGETVVDAEGRTLAPGFIDTHSHHDRGLDAARDGLAMVSQGVTTIVAGQAGGGSNLAALFARHATAAELERMKALVKIEMDAGALGLSIGLEYDPGISSAPEEIVALAKVAADAGGRYASHIRSEDRWFWQALDERSPSGA
jgi:N-acyl-D-amino-acid deacylase